MIAMIALFHIIPFIRSDENSRLSSKKVGRRMYTLLIQCEELFASMYCSRTSATYAKFYSHSKNSAIDTFDFGPLVNQTLKANTVDPHNREMTSANYKWERYEYLY